MRYPTRFFGYSLSPKADTKQSFYHPELDVLRFAAFLAVFMHHAMSRDASLYLNNGLSPTVTAWLLTAKEAGAFGLDLFFALSSYLITELLLREHTTRGSFSVSAFYVRRALRIWPLYFAFLALTVVVIPTILPAERFGPVYIISFALFVGNWVCATRGLPFSVASPLWSISVEEQFYIGWPLLLRFFGVNRLKQLALAMLLLAVAIRIVLAVYGVQHPGVWCNTLARLDPIALGALVAFALNGRSPQMSNAVRAVLCGLALASWWLTARYLRQDGPSSIATYAVSGFASVVLLVAVLRSEAPLLRVPPFSWLVYLGRISYGLYVFHLFALALMAQLLFVPVLGIPLNFELRILFSFLLTVSMAAVSYKFLEQPFLRLKERFRPGSKQASQFKLTDDSPLTHVAT
ncbi:MAG TPA: acyltransferase [Pyrinomonadaceae bacterium]|nr:acyltransferase [Pyrinomonadaceae bacterium]